MTAKRTPQTAAKRARGQAICEKREHKAENKRAATLTRKGTARGVTDGRTT